MTITQDCVFGCTLTQGYWKTHSEYGKAPYDETWGLLANGADTLLPLSGDSWFEVFWTPPKGGNVWYQLAHQWMAAYLNQLAGASTPDEVDAALAGGQTWLASTDPASKPKGAAAAQAKSWAQILGAYNEGSIGPGHCDEDNTSQI